MPMIVQQGCSPHTMLPKSAKLCMRSYAVIAAQYPHIMSSLQFSFAAMHSSTTRGPTEGPERHHVLPQVTVQALARDGAQRMCDGLLDHVAGRSVFLVDFHVWKVPDR